MKKIQFQMHAYPWICYAVGYVFITSGIVALLVSDFRGIFHNLGIPFPEATLFLVAITEVVCGMLLVGRMYIHLAVPPLILIMLGALYLTKIPVLLTEGFLSFAFEARLDIVMLILLIILWQQVRVKT
ncbi:DoxX family protein [Virgibacillus sp. SK37]|uniref:DoxX family protein n=1 Tax=Virgibacillus sp. SK37 TaxID=403957 RepID=UPI000A01F1B3|nr:DoxX family membrane protein [Virgibacillus sp. SK37]